MLFNQFQNPPPLKSLKLEVLCLNGDVLPDLEVLRDMPLTELWIPGNKRVSDLSPLRGKKLKELVIDGTQVRDLTPVSGMPLKMLYMYNTPVTDVRPLEGMELEELGFTRRPETPPAEFWKKYDAGEFK
jgi:Leucine-rich repeat (LRR) protein